MSKRDVYTEHALRFHDLLPSELRKVINILHRNQKAVYIVGGAVRDYLFGIPIGDIDLATNATPQQITKLLNEEDVKVKPIGEKYGTILGIVGKRSFDISTFRREIYHNSTEAPEIKYVDSIEKDLARRDFSFNAIAFDPIKNQFIDIYDGINDIFQKKIVTIGTAQVRFEEDGLRIIRLARFMVKFSLKVEPESLIAIYYIGEKAKFRNKNTLRIEFFKLLKVFDPSEGIKLLWEAQVLSAIFPKFPFANKNHRTISYVKDSIDKFKAIPPRNIILRLYSLLILLTDNKICSQEYLDRIADSLNLTVKHKQILLRINNSWLNFKKFLEKNELKRWIRSTGINTSEDLLQLVFLKAEISGDTVLLAKKEKITNEVNTIVLRLRSTPRSENSLT